MRGRKTDVAAWRLGGLAMDVPAPRDGPFVARHRELEALRAALRGAGAAVACRRLTVVGPPGIGKSRLTRELLAGLGDDAAVTIGRCHAGPAGAASLPLAELIRGVAGEDPEAWTASGSATTNASTSSPRGCSAC